MQFRLPVCHTMERRWGDIHLRRAHIEASLPKRFKSHILIEWGWMRGVIYGRIGPILGADFFLSICDGGDEPS